MRHLTAFICGIVISLFSVTAMSNAPDTKEGMVSLPWDTFVNLWQEAQEEKPREIVPYAFGRALYIGNAQKEGTDTLVRFNATIDVANRSDKEISVPVMSEGLQMESFLINDEPALSTVKDGFYHVVLPSRGDYVLSVSFSQKMASDTWPRTLRVPLSGIARQEIVIHTLDEGIEARLNPGVSMEVIDGADGDQIHGYVPSVASVDVLWNKKSQGVASLPLKMNASMISGVTLRDYGGDILSELNFRILQGRTSEFVFGIAADEEVIDISSIENANPVFRWEVLPTEGNPQVHVFSTYAQDKDFSFKVRLEKRNTENLSWVLPRPVGAERLEGHVVVGAQGNIDLASMEPVQARAMDLKTSPERARALVSGKPLAYFETTGMEPSIELKAKPHVATVGENLSIEKMTGETFFSGAGQALSRAVLSVRNEGMDFLAVFLPKNANLESADMDGKKVVLSRREDGALMVPLHKESDRLLPVTLSWSETMPSIGWMGRVGLSFPKTDSPVGPVSWDVHHDTDLRNVFSTGVLSRLGGNGGIDSKKLKEAIRDRKGGVFSSLLNPTKQGISSFAGTFKSGSNLNVYFLNRTFAQVISLTVTLILSALMFWMLTYFLEPAYLPDRIYGFKPLLKAGLGSLVLAVPFFALDMGFYSDLILGMSLATSIFAFWQNRLLSRRVRPAFVKLGRHVGEIFLVILLAFIPYFVINGWWALNLLVSALLITIQVGLLKAMPSLLKKKLAAKQSEAVVLGLLLSFLFLGQNVHAADLNPSRTSETPQGNVLLEWHVVDGLLKQIDSKERKKATANQVDVAFGSPTIEGSVFAEFAEIKITVPVQVHADSPVRIPLLDQSAIVTEALFNGDPLALNKENGLLGFDARKTGSAPALLEVNLLVPVNERGGNGEFRLNSPLVKGARVNLTLEEGVNDLRFKDVTWQEKKGQQVEAFLGNGETMSADTATRDSLPDDSKQPLKLYAQTNMLATVLDDKTAYTATLQYQVIGEKQKSFRFELPADVVMKDVSGEDMDMWQKEQETASSITYVMKTLASHGGTYQLSLVFDRKHGAEGNVDVPYVVVPGAVRNEGYVAMQHAAAAEVSVSTKDHVRLVDLKELPESLLQSVRFPVVYAARFFEPYDLKMALKFFAPVTNTQMLVGDASLSQTFSTDNKAVAVFRFDVIGPAGETLNVTLPENQKLTRVMVDGHETALPEIVGQVGVLIPETGKGHVELNYEGPVKNLNRLFGRQDVSLPSVGATMDHLETSYYFPQSYRLFAAKGDSVAGSSFIKNLMSDNVSAKPGLIAHQLVLGANAKISTTVSYMHIGLYAALLTVVFTALFCLGFSLAVRPDRAAWFAVSAMALVVILVAYFPDAWKVSLFMFAAGLVGRLIWTSFSKKTFVVQEVI